MLAALAAGAAAAVTPVGVSMDEFRFGVFRDRVPPGRVAFNLTNRGEDAHDLRVASRGYRATSPEVRAGERLRFTVTLRRPGRYRLICTEPGHLAAGMKGSLVVSRRR